MPVYLKTSTSFLDLINDKLNQVALYEVNIFSSEKIEALFRLFNFSISPGPRTGLILPKSNIQTTTLRRRGNLRILRLSIWHGKSSKLERKHIINFLFNWKETPKDY